MAAEREPFDESPFVEAQIYGAFSADADLVRMDQFHAADWPQRATIVESFEDQRLIELGRRLVWYHAPHALPAAVRTEIEAGLALRMLGHGLDEAPWLTLQAAEADAARMIDSCDAEEREIITALRAYLAQQLERCLPYAHAV